MSGDIAPRITTRQVSSRRIRELDFVPPYDEAPLNHERGKLRDSRS